MKLRLEDHWRGDDEADRWCRNVETHPEKYGLRLIARMDYNYAAYVFDYRLVWQDGEGRLWTARDAGCSCPTPFENVKELDRLFSKDDLVDEFFRILKDTGGPSASGEARNEGPRLQEFARFLDKVSQALAGQAG